MTENDLEKVIGTKENPKLTAGSVIVAKVTIEEKPTQKGGKVKIVNLHCKHPDREELVALSNIKLKKVQGNNETIMQDALWYKLDSESNIDKNSNVALLMNYYKKSTLKQFEGSAINTELNAAGYLAIKAY